MPKTKGIKLRIDAFVPIDKTDFTKQAAAYSTLAAIQTTGKIPADFLTTAHILKVDAKDGSAELPTTPAADQGDRTDPANWPLTTDPLPEGAAVLEQTEALDQTMFQTVKLADGTETFRRISMEQATAEAGKGGKKK